jgi:hypothetical protein
MPPYISTIFRDTSSPNKVSFLMRKAHQTIDDVKVPHEFFDGQLKRDNKFAYLWSDLYVGNFLDQFYDPETGENLFENVPETAYEFYISLMAPKASPFIEKFNEVLVRYVETGIHQYHTSRALMDMKMTWIQRVLNGEIPEHVDEPIKLNEIIIVFEIYLYLCAAAFIIFSLELVIYKVMRAKKNRQRMQVRVRARVGGKGDKKTKKNDDNNNNKKKNKIKWV